MKTLGIGTHLYTTTSFVEYLKKSGYPANSIVTEWGNKNFVFDIVVLDHTLSIPLFVFEIKSRKSMNSLQVGIRQLKSGISRFKIPIKCGIVFPSEETPHFENYDVTDVIYADGKITLEELKKYKTLPAIEDYPSRLQTTSANIKIIESDNEKKTLSLLNKLCWVVCPIFVFILVCLDKFCFLSLTSERLIVYGVGILIIFLPFIRQIKYGDYSIILNDDEKENKKVVSDEEEN